MSYKDHDLMRQLLQAFHAEAPEHLQMLNQSLLQLERRPDGPQSAELLQEAFRAAHSLKGAARAVGIAPIEKVAHGVEDVLKQARDNGLRLDPSTCDILYRAFDVIQKLVNGEQPDIEPLIAQLSSLHAADVPLAALPIVEEEMAAQPVSFESDETIRVAVSKLDVLMAEAGELLAARSSAEQRLADMQEVRQQLSQLPRLWRSVKALAGRADDGLDGLSHFEECLHDLTRDVNQLDTAMNRDALRLEMVSGRIQGEMRRVRMVPFQTLEPLFQRTVRDAARLEDKQVELTVEGGEIELDKKVLESLKDSFLHVLRNAVSHGIESPDVRAVLNKPTVGQIRIIVAQRGSEARITVRDDGKGFDLDGLRQFASGHELSNEATNNEIINLAFLPGVTTSQELTALSGRGVGLDVVRRQIEALQGRILVEHQPEQGAAFHFVVPVSLAMTRVLLVSVGSHCYALPLASVERIVRPDVIFSIEGHPMLTLADEPLPLVSLAGILNLPFPPGSDAMTVIIGAADQRIALLVDDVLTEQELAVKPLGQPLVRIYNIAGAAVLGSGEPVVVLNPADLTKAARGVRIEPVTIAKVQNVGEQPAKTRILVVDDSITTRTLEKNILESAGYDVTTATDGVQALQQLKNHTFALVVADVEMPNMDGITLTRYLRDSKEYNELPLILVTSLESADDRERGMVAGANAYIVKRGFNQAELLATIQQFV